VDYGDHPNGRPPGAPVRSGVPEHGRVPEYYAAKAHVASLVDELGEGQALPAERDDLAVRQALRELLLEGRPRRQGRGAVVTGPKQPLSLAGYTEGVRRQGRRPGRNLVTLDRFPCPAALAADPCAAPAEPVRHMERVLLADDERAGLESRYATKA
jgi:GntR family transcriptional regulator